MFSKFVGHPFWNSGPGIVRVLLPVTSEFSHNRVEMHAENGEQSGEG